MKMLKYTGALAAIMLCAYALYAYTPEQAAARMREANAAVTSGDVEKVRQIQEGFKRENSKKPGTYTKQINALQNIINNLVSGAATGGSSRQPQLPQQQPQGGAQAQLTQDKAEAIGKYVTSLKLTDKDLAEAIINIIANRMVANPQESIDEALIAVQGDIDAALASANQPKPLTDDLIGEAVVGVRNAVWSQFTKEEQNWIQQSSNANIMKNIDQSFVNLLKGDNPTDLNATTEKAINEFSKEYVTRVKAAYAAATGGKGPQAGAGIPAGDKDQIIDTIDAMGMADAMKTFETANQLLTTDPTNKNAKIALLMSASRALELGAGKQPIISALQKHEPKMQIQRDVNGKMTNIDIPDDATVSELGTAAASVE